MRGQPRFFEVLGILVAGLVTISACGFDAVEQRPEAGTQHSAMRLLPPCVVAPNPVDVGTEYTVTASGLHTRKPILVEIDDASGGRSIEVPAESDGRLTLETASSAAGVGQVRIYTMMKTRRVLRTSCGFEVFGPCTPTSCEAEGVDCGEIPDRCGGSLDCGACPASCGDGSCDADEDCASCAEDCGACPPTCGDGTCDPDEDCASCARDCGACPCSGDGCGGAAVWISRAEIKALPTSGAAWDNVLDAASGAAGTPDLSNQDDPTNVRIMAKALVYARTGDNAKRDEVLDALQVVTYNDTEAGGRTLALGRELISYVIAADVIGLRDLDPALDQDFRAKLRALLTMELSGRTLVSTHEDRPNNWGTHAGASRVAVAVYLGDQEELESAAAVFRGWLGEREAYADFAYGDLSWQADPDNPVGINPVGATKNGHSIDGVIPDDQRRCGAFSFPPCRTNYAWAGLQGAMAQAVILARQGYQPFQWGDQALRRAVDWLHDTTFEDGNNYPAVGDDEWQPWVVNYYYCTDFPAESSARSGKGVGWTDWTHASNPACP